MIYRAAISTKGAITAMDWGDRVLLIREPTGERRAAERFVADTGVQPLEFEQHLKQQFRKWGIELMQDTVSGQKRNRQDTGGKRERKEYPPPPPRGDQPM